MSTKTLIGILLASSVGLVIFLFVHLSSGPNGPIKIGTNKAQACNKGQDGCLPDVTYIDTTGKAYNLQSLAGKVVVVNFWATWCGPCQKEIPALSKIYDQYKSRGVVMLGVLTNDNPTDGELLNFTSDNSMSYPIVRNNSDILVSYNYPGALPTTFVFDRGGHQVGKPRVGAIHIEDLTAMLDELVAQK
ncbi:MAG: alkyl hydroperoxide reductase/Thiol specific antioxidant/Mal allergen [Myxococcales bacterium]|nr:alkyl hydroperoxide reductase/Thiol specific antioxidant/Mal allergen [Myxococcales bacterium]